MIQCRECGMLALLSSQNGEQWVCANQEFRDTGLSRLSYLGTSPRCDARATKFSGQYEPMLKEIEKDRPECLKFLQWHPSLRTPKEHLEMFSQQIALDLQKSIADIQGRIADSNSKTADSNGRIADLQTNHVAWKKEQADKDGKFSEKLHRLELWQVGIGIATVLVAVAALVVSVVALCK